MIIEIGYEDFTCMLLNCIKKASSNHVVLIRHTFKIYSSPNYIFLVKMHCYLLIL